MNRCIALIVIVSVFTSCESIEQKETRLAKQYCGSCHLFPEPSLLPKATWTKSVLPNMAFRMGLMDLLDGQKYIAEEDLMTVAQTLPGYPMVSEEEWKHIVNYFEKNAPDELPKIERRNIDTLTLFERSRYKNSNEPLPLITMIKADTINKKIIVGTRNSSLYILNNKFEVDGSGKLTSPPSHVILDKNNEMTMSIMGIMDPNDRPLGKIVTTDPYGRVKEILIDSLKRPVYIEKADLNSDGLEDFIVCAFGNYTGGIYAYENRGNSKYIKHTISYLPGSRKTVLKDINNDGKLDIIALLTQGDEQITSFINDDNFNFKQKTLLRFPPVYGSSYFEIADFNQDGLFDLLYTSGDNSDYSLILKPYHGVKIFTQETNGEFIESWHYPMHGASQAMAFDFDQDGDLDIAAISFFADYYSQPDEGFFYFENTNQQFKPYKLAEAAIGRWLIMETADIDDDGDRDILLGALDFNNKVPQELMKQWNENQTSILILKNKTH